MRTIEKVTDNEGKYEVIIDESGRVMKFYATRYGEYWRDLIGDNLVLAMFHRIQYLEDTLKEAGINPDD